jgi:hypothetical protein
MTQQFRASFIFFILRRSQNAHLGVLVVETRPKRIDYAGFNDLAFYLLLEGRMVAGVCAEVQTEDDASTFFVGLSQTRLVP